MGQAAALDPWLIVLAVAIAVIAVTILLLRFALRAPWWAAVPVPFLVAVIATLLPNTTAGQIERLVLILVVVFGAVIWANRQRSVPLRQALLWGAAIFVALGMLLLPIHTHAVKIDMPSPHLAPR
ncbi:MAG TPA: hypothetical protein VLV55_07375 [Rhizomicrobium sp.]|nr:hypothetical protein [Rhizomicrobium sp.]